MRQSIIKSLPILILFSILLSGCAGWIKTEQPSATNWVDLTAGQTIGQTFVAKYNGLAGIYFYLSPQKTGSGEIKLHLRASPQATEDLASSSNTVSINTIKAAGYYGFFVPAQAASNQVYYYAVLEATGSGGVLVGKAGGDTYIDGALYQNGAPQDAQAAFQLSYSRRKAILGLAQESIVWAGILLLGLFLFILPGWGLISLLWSGWGGITWPEKLGLAAGMSLAIYPLLILWTSIIGLRLGAIYSWLPPLAGLGIILWRFRKRMQPGSAARFNFKESLRASLAAPDWAAITFVCITILIVLTRFWAIRSLDVPLWGDSYQHTMMAQLIVDHGGLFNSWQPYAELTTFTYHFGFHSTVAVFDWLTHLDMPKAMLWVGQLFNILAVTALYPLATKVGRSRWAGVAAVLVAGLLLPMPMYYVNWGRYTQLAGQVIMPGAVYLAWTALDAQDRDWRLIGLVWIVMAGLAVTHYLVTILTSLFFVALMLLRLAGKNFRKLLPNLLILFGGVIVLFFPWFIHVFLGKLPNILAYYVAAPTKAATTFLQDFNAIGNLTTYMPIFLWLVLFVCLGWGFWRREKGVVLIGLWWFLNLLATNPQWLHLPGEGVITNFTLFIAAYIPAGILIGAGFGWLLPPIRRILKAKEFPGRKWAFSLLIFVVLLGIGLSNVINRLEDVQIKSSALVTRPDIMASDWIKNNTPQNAVFLVNSFFAYGDTLIAGTDGGWWLPLLAGRQTTLPPLTYGSESGPRPDYIPWINELATKIQNNGVTSANVMTLFHQRGVGYIYVGQQGGSVNNNGITTINPTDLSSSPLFRLVYHQDRVWIFEVLQ